MDAGASLRTGVEKGSLVMGPASLSRGSESRGEECREKGPACSDTMRAYFQELQDKVDRCYAIANEARGRGLDPETHVEIPQAKDLAARVEELVGPRGVAQRIREVAREIKNRELTAIEVAKEVAAGFDGPPDKALDQAVRTGLAILTEGVLVAPLEGIAKAKICRNDDGSRYASIFFAGPIRSAGGTGQAMAVLIGDIVRRALGLDRYRPRAGEIERFKEEIPAYKRAQHLQYTPTAKEIDLIVSNCPICIDGEGTEDEEVSGNRDLERVETNRLRGGACLVVAEGLCLKAPKLLKNIDKLGIDGWDFLKELVSGRNRNSDDREGTIDGNGDGENRAQPENGSREEQDGGYGKEKDPDAVVSQEELEDEDYIEKELRESLKKYYNMFTTANFKYIKELIAGRPVFSHPSKKGGFRLRYGRARTAGIAATPIHPAAMYLVDEFLAIGTQIKIERPGKAGLVVPCDTIEPPAVLLRNGDFIELRDPDEAIRFRPEVEKIMDLGEILIPFGEFAENNHELLQGSYSPEWWLLELEKILKSMPDGGERQDEGSVETVRADENTQIRTGTTGCSGVSVETVRTDEKEWTGVEKTEMRDLEAKVKLYGKEAPGQREAIEIALRWGVPLHPRYNLFWHDISMDDWEKLRSFTMENGEAGSVDIWTGEVRSAGMSAGTPAGGAGDAAPGDPDGEYQLQLVLPYDETIKDSLLQLGALHFQRGGKMIICRHSLALLRCLGLDEGLETLAGLSDERIQDIKEECKLMDAPLDIEEYARRHDMTTFVSRISGITVRPRSPTRIGTRMGRPEKAKMRKMHPPIHGLFPLGDYGGRKRSIKNASRMSPIRVKMGFRRCAVCGYSGYEMKCPACDRHTEIDEKKEPDYQTVNLSRKLEAMKHEMGMIRLDEARGVIGMTSRHKIPEPVEKAFLRARHDVYVFKDGTVRFDVSDAPLTHFRPSEIGLSLDRAREMGYTKDHLGNPLTSPGQLLELRVQDVIVPTQCGRDLLKVARYTDDLLVGFYGLERFYRASDPEDLIGHLLIGLAPHTSGGVLCRLVGYTRSRVAYAHPFFHTAKRRNCDGDEDAFILLMDGLLNFSRQYIPEKRGGLMDAPLVLTTRIDPAEIDKESHNVDLLYRYPLEFYEAASRRAGPKEVEKIMDTVGGRIGTPFQYEGFGFTHDTSDISQGPRKSAYTKLKSMLDKTNAQLALGGRLIGVNEADVASRVIETHFIPDLIGNLNAFSRQTVRCTKCNAKYRRIPLRGVCTSPVKSKKRGYVMSLGGRRDNDKEQRICGNKLTMTVHEGGVKKYLGATKDLMQRYNVSEYTKQRVMIIEKAIQSIFRNDRIIEFTLDEFF